MCRSSNSSAKCGAVVESDYIEYKLLLKAYVAGKLMAVEPRGERVYLQRRLAGMVGNPTPEGARLLPGYSDRFRLRLSCHQIVYRVDEARKELTVVALRVRNRHYLRYCENMSFEGE